MAADRKRASSADMLNSITNNAATGTTAPTPKFLRSHTASSSSIFDAFDPKVLKDATPKRSYDEPGSPSASAKAQFQKLVRRYYYQLTIGCGHAACPHRLCASCRYGVRLTSEAAGLLSISLASRPKRFFCPRCPPEPDIHLDASILASPASSLHQSPINTPRPMRRISSEGQIPWHIIKNAQAQAQNTAASPAAASRPFLYSLLSSSPFQSLFAPDPSVATTSSTSNSNRNINDKNAQLSQNNSIQKTTRDLFGDGDGDEDTSSVLSPTTSLAVRQRRGSGDSLVSPEDTSTLTLMSGLRALTKYATGLADSSGKSKSLMDLPSLFSANVFAGPSKPPAVEKNISESPPSESIAMSQSSSEGPLPQPTLYSSSPQATPRLPPMTLAGKSPLRSFASMDSLDIDGDGDQDEDYEDAMARQLDRQVSLGYLTLPLLKQAIDACRSGSEGGGLKVANYNMVLHTVRNVFSSSSALSRSFLREAGSDHTLAHPSGLDLPSVRAAYKDILRLTPQESFALVLSNATELLLAKIELNAKRLSSAAPATLRQLLIALENPLIADQAYHETLMKKLCIIMGTLRPSVQNILTDWFSKYDAQGLTALTNVFHKYILCHFVPTARPDESLIGCIKCLNLLSEANNYSHLVPISAFYSDTLSRKLNFKEEYKLWQKGWLKKSSGLSNTFHTRQHFQYQGHSVPATTGTPPSSSQPPPPPPLLSATSTTRGPIGIALSNPFNPAKLAHNATNAEFCYFDYPMLFDPASKTRILHIDAMVQMSAEFEDAFVNQALVLHTQRFLQDSTSTDSSREPGLKQATNPYLVLEVRRERLVQDALDQIRRNEAHLKRPFRIKFVNGGEEGMDQGGVQKEFFQVLCGLLLDPAYGMFTQDDETRLVWINGASLEAEAQFELVGTVIGLAAYNGVILGVSFPTLLYKKLLDESVGLEDVKQAFPALGRGLRQLLDWTDGDVADVFLRTFEISYDVYGQVRSFPLVDGGADILVTNENRRKYVDLYIRHLVGESVKRQFSAFKRGFLKVCGGDALRMCRAQELELLVCGSETTELDFSDLEEAAEYDDGYHAKHPTIQNFWHIVHSFNLRQKRLLLTFVTASDRVPVKGLGHVKFVVQRNGPDTERLPTALTCFGRLLLPEYASVEKMKERLVTAIENAKGFGLV
ncbi:hypothetical protein SeMB42_g00833 [Synchytrium endobioticum]|uniref:HECT-type E3 ubiquitin transferase n=1 Tax=Synchytrium endobioticum TaxID=286115 RepID=A0A507DNV2_9FUNG|nr:hypothetical protein SeLEV6574_g01798 [Synchytrium endobioticum]TPX53344.1 hypothetical protein SeMB42_g00833 [Synchytrium endobioticum]